MEYMTEKEIRKHKKRHKLSNKLKKWAIYGSLILAILLGGYGLAYLTSPGVVNYGAGITEEEPEYGTFNYDKMDI